MQKFAHIFAYMKLPISFHDFDHVDKLGPGFIGLQLYQLLSVINAQGNRILENVELGIPSRIASSLMLFKMNGPLSVTQLGSMLNMSHQLMAHRIKALKDLELITEVADPKDKRRTLYRLTEKGEAISINLEEVIQKASSAYEDLYEEIGVNVYEALIKARKALLKKPLSERINQ